MLKKYAALTLFLWSLCLVANAQIVNIPDANFKNALAYTSCVDLNGDGVGDVNADTNNDGEIQVSEALEVLRLNVNSRSIESLTGIEAFGNLQKLDCSQNQLTTLDVQALTNLQDLDCSQNQLTILEVQAMTNLQALKCGFNQLTTLEVQGLTNLQYLSCYANQLTTLEVQPLTNLQNLSCYANQLTTLEVQGLTKLGILFCSQNQLTTLDVQGLTNLQSLHCSSNQITTLDVQGLTKLYNLDCLLNQLTTLNVQGLTNLQKLYCSSNQLTTLDVQGLNLQDLDCRGNQLTTLNVQGLTNLKNLDCFYNQLTTLNVQGLTNLQSLSCGFNQLTTLDVQGLTNLKELYCASNQLITLYIKNGSIETILDFGNNPLLYICCDQGQLSSVQAKATQYGLTNCLVNTSCIQIGAHIQGEIKHDLNLNCQSDSSETGLAGRIIKAEKSGSDPSYGITNGAGYYEIVVDTGLYRLSVPNALTNNYYALCADSIWVNLPQIDDTVHTDFLLKPVVFCPLLEVNIGSSIMRRCFENQYIIQYCNIGPAPAPNAQVTVTLSDDVQFISSTIPGVNIGGQDWQFSLGAVASEACGSFKINFLVICDSTVLGQSICATAHITPDSVCTAPGSNWSGAEVMVDGYCEGDSVRLVIRNIGTGDMTSDQEFVVIEDMVIFREGVFNLTAQDSLVITVPANGSTYHMEAGQEATFPFFSQPSVTVEGCGLNLGGLFTLGFVSQFNEDDGNPFYSKDCREIIGSYDPNDKSAQPLGVGNAHYILPNTPIDYLIRFQNTGTDTAFTVVIRDTLSQWLDVETFKAGISDHAFRLDIEGANILKFTFDNILLPDSNVNEAASHGFVRFRITPKSSTPLGTKIDNRAAIFFDFNAPIITNWVFHTVDTGFLERKTVSVFSGTAPAPQQIYPNPVRSGDLLYFENLPIGTNKISLIDPLGKVVFAAELLGNSMRVPNGLASGIYFLEQTGDGGKKRWGKVLVKQ
jgi:Leucine-rich repeat (LRR) protein